MNKNDAKLAAKIAAVVVVIITILVTGLISLQNAATSSQCSMYSTQTGRETKFVGGLFTKTCYVRIGSEWYSIDQVRTEP